MVTGVELHDAVRPAGELTLALGRRAAVLSADEVRRFHLLPGSRPHRLLEDREALPGRLAHGLLLDLRVAVLEERLGQGRRVGR